MSARFRDVLLPMVMITLLSPVAAISFKYGVPIEVIVFSLLLAGYKASSAANTAGGAAAAAVATTVTCGSVSSSSSSLRRSWSLSWRRSAGGDSKPSWRQEDNVGTLNADKVTAKKVESKSVLGALKRSTPKLQWRSIINKFTPEKFDKLCEQLLSTLPSECGERTVTDDEFRQVLEDLLALIFDASSRQHQYTEMYTDLCQKLMDFVAKQRPDLDSKSCVWAKCQGIFKTMVLSAPDIPADLPEDEYMDRKAKHKEKMVGIVKFGGDLVSRGLVPSDGVMLWIQTLVSEKTQEIYSAGSDANPAEQGMEESHDKDIEKREVQLELLCAILAGMGSSLQDRHTLTEQNRLVIEDVFMQLEQLSMDTVNLSLRIRCLIRDILDLRMAQWKEKEGRLKPGMLKRRDDDSGGEVGSSYLREDAPEFVPGSNAAWTSDRISSHQAWLDPSLLASLQAVEHHLEVIEDKESKLERLKRLIKFYHIIQEQQLVVVANASNVSRVLGLVEQSFSDVVCQALDWSITEQQRKKSLKGFETGDVSVLVMASEVSTRRDFDTCAPAAVLVNFDFPMTLQLYLYRLYKRSDSNTHVYTFFMPHYDVRHTMALTVSMDAVGQKIPEALRKLKDQLTAESSSNDRQLAPGGKGRDRNHERERERDRDRERERDRDRERSERERGSSEHETSRSGPRRVREQRGDEERERERDRDRDRGDGCREGTGDSSTAVVSSKGAGKSHHRTRASTSASWRSDFAELRSERSELEEGRGGDRADQSSRSDRDGCREVSGGRRNLRGGRLESMHEDGFLENGGPRSTEGWNQGVPRGTSNHRLGSDKHRAAALASSRGGGTFGTEQGHRHRRINDFKQQAEF